MAEKDTAEKILADYNDVFADIVNVLLFQGERMISPNQLQSVNVHTQAFTETTVLQVIRFWKRSFSQTE